MEKLVAVSRHGLSILNVSVLHHLSNFRDASVQDQRFGLRDFEVAPRPIDSGRLRLLCYQRNNNSRLHHLSNLLEDRNQRHARCLFLRVQWLHHDFRVHTKWPTNARAAVDMEGLVEVTCKIVPKSVENGSHQGHLGYSFNTHGAVLILCQPRCLELHERLVQGVLVVLRAVDLSHEHAVHKLRLRAETLLQEHQ